MEQFAALVRNQRLQLGMSQKELSEVTGIDQPTLSRIELGDRKISLREALILMRALGIPEQRLADLPLEES